MLAVRLVGFPHRSLDVVDKPRLRPLTKPDPKKRQYMYTRLEPQSQIFQCHVGSNWGGRFDPHGLLPPP